MVNIYVMVILITVTGSMPVQTGANSDQDSDQMVMPQRLAPPLDTLGRTATIGNGRIGERQTRDQTAPENRPLDRIQSRIANRVDNRLRTRIDRSYNPDANAQSLSSTTTSSSGRAR
jgi:hypothetical protein